MNSINSSPEIEMSEKTTKPVPEPVTGEVTTEAAPTNEKAPEGPIVVGEVDRLRLENAQLKLMNLGGQRQDLISRLERCDEAGAEAQATYARILEELKQKYGFDPNTQEMRADTGLIVPKGQTIRGPIG
jgi:hypothetical protein